MPRIVPAILCVDHPQKWQLTDASSARPERCPICGLTGLWGHGTYLRKPDRNGGQLNPVKVPRYRCGRKEGCGASCSILPSPLAPRRWYAWAVQQAVLMMLLAGASLRRCADTLGVLLGPTRSTVRRWGQWLAQQHARFAFHLLNDDPDWGRCADWQAFWQCALEQRRLETLMLSLDRAGVAVP